MDDVLNQEASLEVSVISTNCEAVGLHPWNEMFIGPTGVFAAEREEDVKALLLVKVVFLDTLKRSAEAPRVQPHFNFPLVLEVDCGYSQGSGCKNWKKVFVELELLKDILIHEHDLVATLLSLLVQHVRSVLGDQW